MVFLVFKLLPATSVDNFNPHSSSKAGLEIDAESVAGEISDHEPTFPKLGDDVVVNVLVVLLFVDSDWVVAGIQDPGSKAIGPYMRQIIRERHRNECLVG